MYTRQLTVCVLIFGGLHCATANAAPAADPPGATCAEFNHRVLAQAGSGQLKEAEEALVKALSDGSVTGLGPSCDWVMLQNMAAIMSRSGRIEEAENYAARAVSILEKSYPPDDLFLLRPLHMLSAARIQQGKVAAARDAFQRMQRIPIDAPSDRALLHGTGAVLLQAEGRIREAANEYVVTIAAWDEAGRGETMDVAALHNGLADLYLASGQFEAAGRALDRALAICRKATDAGLADRLRLLNTQAVLFAHSGQWRNAEENLRSAISLAESGTETGGKVDPVILEPLLDNYAQVLRANHQAREARAVEQRAATLQSPALTLRRSLVDTTQLRAESNGAGK